MLESIRYVDLVIPEENWEQKITDINEFKIDIFVIGDISVSVKLYLDAYSISVI